MALRSEVSSFASGRRRGQALVEFALILPIMLVLLLGFAELALLFGDRVGFQNGTDVLAQWAAEEMASHPGESWKAGWQRVVREEAERVGCVGDGPDVSFPDGDHLPGDRVLVEWACTYQPRLSGDIGVLKVHVQSEAVVPGVLPPASPPQSASPSVSP